LQNRSPIRSKINGSEPQYLKKRVVIVTGELSGENHAVSLVRALGSQSIDFSAIGSNALRNAGVEIIHDYHDISLIGFEILTKIGHIARAYTKLKKHLTAAKPDLVILVDFAGFNLLLVSRLTRALGIPTVYFIPPQLWTWWTEGRIRRIKERIDLVLCVFPFEEELYRSHGVPVTYVGHPYVQSVKPKYSREDFCRLIGVDSRIRLLTMMAGSRTSEVKNHMPVLMKVTELLERRVSGLTVLLPVAESLDESLFEPFLRGRNSVVLVKGMAHDCLAHSDAALVKSGSSTLEAAILGVPSLVYYRMSWLSYRIARSLAKVPFIALPNLIAGKEIFPEFVQSVDAAAVAKSLLSVLQSQGIAVRKDIEEVRNKLVAPERDPYQSAAEHILRLLEHRNATLPKTS
jgi:lipid-A-disaccharide synthase